MSGPLPSVLVALQDALDARERAGLARRRRTLASAQGPHVVVDGVERLAFASNDYLGLAADPSLAEAVRESTLRWGVGAGASHLVAGHAQPHVALEDELAAFVAPCEGARALAFSSGYLANLAVLTALAGRGDAVFADRLDHACLNDGALLSRAAFVRYAHGDVDALARRLASTPARRRIVAVDGVFSMDGDIAPLPEILALAERHDALVLVDDAHAFGVLGRGRGTAAHFGLVSPRLVVMGTLGKAAGTAGAFVAGHPAVIETLVQTARPYVYTTAAPAMLAQATRAALVRIRDGEALRRHLDALTGHLRQRLEGLPWRLMPSRTPIQPLVVGGNEDALALAQGLWDAGLWVPAIRPPTVPEGTARLRISLSAAHAIADVDRLADALHALAKHGGGMRTPSPVASTAA